MKSSVETLEGNKVKLYIEVAETEFEHDVNRAFKQIAKEVNLPGFRNGKAPRKLLEAKIGVGPAREQALRDAVPVYLSEAIREHEVDLVATPEIEVTSGQDDGVVEFEAVCETRPIIMVPGYNGLRIELDSPTATSDDIAAAQHERLKAEGSLVDADRPAESGDFLTLDMAASRDGEDVIGLNTEDWSYELGQGWVTEDFDEQVTGASVGDVITFTSSPKGIDDDADFTVAVKAVQVLELPELTDEWVADNTAEFETIAEWEAKLTEELSESKLEGVRESLMAKMSDALVELVDVELPDAMVQTELKRQFQGFAGRLQQQGIDMETWFSATGQDASQFLEGMRPQAENGVKLDLALRAVAEAENLDLRDGELDAEFARMAMQFGQKAKDVRKAYEEHDAIPDLIADLRKSKAMDWLLHHVEMVDGDGNKIDNDFVMGHSMDAHRYDGVEGDEDTDDADTSAS